MSRTDPVVLNDVPEEQAAQRLAACNASPRWIGEMLEHRPYASVAALLDTAERVARSLDWSEVSRALEAHPRIGDSPAGDSVEAQWSRREQAAVGGSGSGTQAALREGNVAYERQFGHVFLIRAAGRSAGEMLAELHRRLGNDVRSERAEVTEQLAQITRARLERLLAP
ncbi:2-oxo-4-hydroxy-4-carboxy-5-ureidoimidazoline decarboxylase [Actinoplanes sp. URMC 104]|uniref:2-oxo-4-hydroxy-4-carboxy-5-ureidoimidazoline decarboxylase n=1 Tax=Actinoplanes sp. URMC 104 TaxID=3423409 RepID=UPI003F19FA6C